MAEVRTQDTSGNITSHQNVKVLTLRYAGFPISHADALAWANRFRAANDQRILTEDPKHSGMIRQTLDHIVKSKGGAGCYSHGRIVPGQPYEKYIILTQFERGRKWLRINGTMEPGAEFVPGQREAIGEELLKEEGISYEPFETCFSS